MPPPSGRARGRGRSQLQLGGQPVGAGAAVTPPPPYFVLYGEPTNENIQGGVIVTLPSIYGSGIGVDVKVIKG
jgi:hypothetical protein